MKPNIRALLHSKSFVFHVLPTAVVLVAFLSITFWAYLSSVDSVRREEQRIINSLSQEVQTTISNRLTTYEEVLRSSGGMIKATGQVRPDQWQDYISFNELSRRYPGIKSVGFMPAVSPDQVPSFLEYARSSVNPDYTIQSSAPTSLYTPVLLVTPGDDSTRSVLGFNMYAESSRRVALDAAAATGAVTMTNKLTLYQDKPALSTIKKPGFLLFAPIYTAGSSPLSAEQKRASLQGFVYASFRAEDLLNGIFEDSKNSQEFGFRIYAGQRQPEQLLYESKAYELIAGNGKAIRLLRVLEHYGTSWVMEYAFSPTVVPDSFRGRPYGIIGAGVLLSILTAGLIFSLLIARSRSLASSKEREVQSAKDDLLSLASHQLRTPATGVKQYIGMVLEGYAGSLKNEQRMYLEKAYESNERQLHIINELLYVAKADAGRIILAKRQMKINELIKDIIAEQKQTAKDHSISIRVKLPNRDRLITADKHCLRMSIENLLSNAIKYTPDGGKIRITVSIESRILSIAVKDTGVGIKESDLSLLFSRFTRIPNDLSYQTSGSGIGLYLAKTLIELHGGNITVSSVTGKGTTFTIEMPI